MKEHASVILMTMALGASLAAAFGIRITRRRRQRPDAQAVELAPELLRPALIQLTPLPGSLLFISQRAAVTSWRQQLKTDGLKTLQAGQRLGLSLPDGRSQLQLRVLELVPQADSRQQLRLASYHTNHSMQVYAVRSEASLLIAVTDRMGRWTFNIQLGDGACLIRRVEAPHINALHACESSFAGRLA